MEKEWPGSKLGLVISACMGTSVYAPMKKDDALSNTSRLEVYKGSGTDISARSPANLSPIHLKSSRGRRNARHSALLMSVRRQTRNDEKF